MEEDESACNYTSTNETVWAEHSGLQSFVLNLITYVTPLFICVGLVTNTMSLLVFAGTYLKRQSMSVYLAALACADSVFLLSLFMHWLTFVSVNVIAVQGVCQLVVYASFCSCFLSIWFLVSCSVERYIAICHPLRKPEMCTTRRACAVVLGLVIFCCAAYSVTLWLSGVSTTCTGHRLCEPVKGGGQGRRLAQIVADVAVTLILPFLIIVILNTAISKSMASFYSDQAFALTLVESCPSNSPSSTNAPLLPTFAQAQPTRSTRSTPVSSIQPSNVSPTAVASSPIWSRQTSLSPIPGQGQGHSGGRTSPSLRPPSTLAVHRSGNGGFLYAGSGSRSGLGTMENDNSNVVAMGTGGLAETELGAGGADVVVAVVASSRKRVPARSVPNSLYTRAQMKLTKMLLLLSSLFLLFNLPDYAMRFHMFLQTINQSPSSHTQLLIAEIFHFAHNVTFASKFLLFYACSTKFRQAFQRFWRQVGHKIIGRCQCPRRTSLADSQSECDNDVAMMHAHRQGRLQQQPIRTVVSECK